MWRPSREGPKYFVSSKFTSGYRKLSQINDFLIPSTGAQARRTCRRGAPERERARERKEREKAKGRRERARGNENGEETRRSTKDIDHLKNSQSRSRGWAVERRRVWARPWRGNPTKNAYRSTICKPLYCNVCKLSVREKEGETIARRPQRHHFPSYS